MKYIDSEKLIKSVNNYREGAKAALNPIDGDADYYKGKIDACKDIQEFITSLLQEQPEGLHFTPLNRLVQKIPSEKWNDSTNNYAKKLRDCLIKEGYRKDAEVLQGYISYMNGNNVPMATMDEKEQPDFPTTADRLVSLAECLEMDGDCLFNGYSGTECGEFLRELARKKIGCKPAEWSEEDEKQLNDIIGLLPDLTIRHAWLLDIKQRLKSIPKRFSLQPKQEQREVDLEKSIEFECIGKKVKMTVQELINYYIDSECRDVADECEF